MLMALPVVIKLKSGKLHMKKILLGTTVLVGAAALFAGAANAETPKVTVGGFADFQVGVVGEDADAGTRPQSFRSDTEISFRIDGKTDAGLGYGGGVDLEADTTADADAQGLNASRTFIYVDGSFGRVEAGSEVGAQGTMKVDASSIARATGGIDGDFTYFTTVPGAAQYLATPDLVLGYGAGSLGDESQENMNKVTYYTPRFAGFQLGVSYIVDNANQGQVVSRANAGAPGDATVDNIFAGGISYDNKFGDFGVTVAATGEHGEATLGTNEDLKAWNVGGKVTYMGFSVAGSYGDLGDSLRTAGDDATYWTLGGAYEFGAFAASVTYMDSEYETAGVVNDFSNLSVGADYKLAPGFTPYAEVSFVELDAAGAALDNDATVFIAGTQLSF